MAADPEASPPVAITELAVILMATRIDPAHINPDFLRHNHIVAPPCQPEYPVITEPGLSLVKYANGLSLTATHDYLSITHRGDSLELSQIASPAVAGAYLAKAPWPVDYTAAQTDLTIQIPMAEHQIEYANTPLQRVSSGLPYLSCQPEIQTRARYKLPGKSVTMTVYEKPTENLLNSVRFTLSIRRSPDENLPGEDKPEFVKSAITGWRQDVDDLIQLALRFHAKYED